MAGQTLSEKLLSRKAGRVVRAGEIAICTVDFALGTDASVPMALDYFDAMGGTAPLHPAQLVFAFDHYAPAPSAKSALLQARIRKFASAHAVKVFDVGAGIGHQLMVEQGYARPGRLLVGADSHSVMYGAAGCFATGIGSSDLAAVMMSGKVWLKVPASIRVELVGKLAAGVGGKDIALALARILGADGAAYKTLEFYGDGIVGLDFDDRLTIANMVIEMGAKNALFPVDATVREYLATRPMQGVDDSEDALTADDDAQYAERITLDLATVEPNVARPHQVDNVVTVSELEHTPIHMAYLGTCTGGRVKDFQEALAVLRAHGGPAPGVQLVVTPASREIMEALVRGGELADFLAFGAIVVTPGCGSCCGTGGAIPGDGVNVVSTANRNFKGRMGNADANIYLASPQVCAASAVAGYLVAPSQLGHRS